MDTTSLDLNDRPYCQKCGLEINQCVGVCAGCVLQAAVKSLSPSDHPALGPIAVRGRCPSPETLNQQFPDFEFSELLGRGGSGWTFLATQKSLSRNVAIKLISRADSHRNELERFQKEAGNLAKLTHSNIVTVHDFGATDQFLYIVMEYVPKLTLRRLISDSKLAPELVSKIGSQICHALEHAHEIGLVHRDIKPENILVVRSDPEVEIRVADFGISQFTPSQGSRGGFTQTGLIIGTPFYMAPEQQVPGKTIDRRADIFSTSVVLYELLTGQLPQGNFAPPSELSNCGPDMDAAIMRALSNDPNNRFDSAAEFAKNLESLGTPKTENLKFKTMAAALAMAGIAMIAIVAIALFQLKKRDSDQASTLERDASHEEVQQMTQPEIKTAQTDVETGPPEDESAETAEPSGLVDASESPPTIPKVYQKLLDEISDDDYWKTRKALTSLRDVPPVPEIAPITEHVFQLTKDTNPFIASDALDTLLVLNLDQGLKAMEQLLQGGHRARLRAISKMGELADPKCIPILAKELSASDSSWILSALKKIGPESESALIDFLEEAEGWVKMKPTIEALGEIGTEKSYEILERLTSSKEAFVGSAATTAIGAIKIRVDRESPDH